MQENLKGVFFYCVNSLLKNHSDLVVIKYVQKWQTYDDSCHTLQSCA